MSIKKELIELEKQFWNAPPDGSVYENHMSSEGRVLMPSPAGSMDREQTIEAVEGSDAWSSYEFRDLKCHELNTDAATLTYRASATRSEPSQSFELLISSTYRKENGAWKLVTHQQTPLTAGK